MRRHRTVVEAVNAVGAGLEVSADTNVAGTVVYGNLFAISDIVKFYQKGIVIVIKGKLFSVFAFQIFGRDRKVI